MSAWDLAIDLGLISVLLLVGVVLRAKVGIVQRLFIPASIIAGGIGLTLGPNGLDWLPFSGLVSEYPTVLIAVIFGAIPIGAAKVNWKQTFGRVRNMWVYSMLLTLLMWGGGAMVTYLIIARVWDIPTGFGLVLGAGFLGGHGTAAAVGEAFSGLGWEEATALGYTSATIGLICAILGGLLLIKKNTRNNQTNFISDFEELPNELRTGLVPKENRPSSGENTVSSNTVDPLFFHIAILAVVVMVSYFLQVGIEATFPQVSIPLLSLSFVVGLLMQFVLNTTKGNHYVDKRVIDRLAGTATDLIVAFGITSINLAVVAAYAWPLLALFVFGVIWAYCIFHFIAPRVFHRHWFENAIFGWGWSTGTVAMGIALLRIVDPKSKSTTLDDYALGYVGMVPVEIMVITFGPIMMMAGFGGIFSLILLGTSAVLIIIAAKSGWLASIQDTKKFNRDSNVS
ncbi:sodium:glutamate symporter [Halobacillus shinanisalinarum]|uniref:Sodium:glutamate symporter n=1 Tax=Halobacillus shinanisalinarum TaxID=2932258 RepID=A0ABY4GW37_9BACI|nr:sodium:glutamate symporter [Halobacillus shinanisalinarum]UOQ92380.1 sodium:glutamate symporter [Halobacillus shinanisalinarum]